MNNFDRSGKMIGRVRRRAFLAGLVAIGAGAMVACGAATSGQAPGGAASPAAASSGPVGTTASVQMTDDNTFSPATVTILKGGTVTWTNASSMQHTATDDHSKAVYQADVQLPDGVQPWDSGLLPPGQTYSHKFDVVGTYKYFCVPHEALGMLGTVMVQ